MTAGCPGGMQPVLFFTGHGLSGHHRIGIRMLDATIGLFSLRSVVYANPR
jgi:hypothetical protein